MAGEDAWLAPNYFWSEKGDIKAHTLLQCCLLLGAKVDAWLCLGMAYCFENETDRELRPHVWVLAGERFRQCQAFRIRREAKTELSAFRRYMQQRHGANAAQSLGGRNEQEVFDNAIGKVPKKKTKVETKVDEQAEKKRRIQRRKRKLARAGRKAVGYEGRRRR